MIFAQPLEPLTRRQRNVAIVLGVLIALTRLVAVSRSMWDWDEALFTLGVRDYDVPSHNPHPPGYPLFILAAKIIHLIVPSELRAVQAVVVLAAMALFPALFLLARELRFPFAVAAGAAALCAFFPNVWYYGGTALSDIPSVVLVMFAAALLLRGCRERNAYLLGALVLGVAAGVRSQNLMIGFAPAVVATWCRRRAWRDVAAAAALGAAVVLASYAGAALASSSWREYLAICALQSRYIHDVDSFFNPTRPSLLKLGWTIFLHPMHSGRFDLLLSALAAIGLAVGLRRAGTLVAVAMFVPFQIFTWLMLDITNFSRYAVGYVPLYALLIASALPQTISPWIVFGCVARLVYWTLPALNEVRRHDSPVAAAIETVPPRGTVYVHGGMGPFASALLPRRNLVFVDQEKELPAAPGPYLREGRSMAPSARTFRRDRRSHLAMFVRDHYFEVTVMNAADAAVFRDGWYSEESNDAGSWRWMGSRATMLFPPAGPRARLTLHFSIPAELHPTLTLRLNGAVIDRVACAGEMTKSWDLAARGDALNELVIETDRAAKPPNDPRDLGLQLLSYEWRAE